MAVGTKQHFQARSAARNQRFDAETLQMLKAPCEDVCLRLQSELNGLRARHALAADRAVSSLENSGDFGEREPEDERAILLAERELSKASERMQQLAAQLRHLKEILSLIDRWPLPTQSNSI